MIGVKMVKSWCTVRFQWYGKTVLFLAVTLLLYKALRWDNRKLSYERSLFEKEEYISKIETAMVKGSGGEYVIIPNIVTPPNDRSIADGVTLCTQCSSNHLPNLQELSIDWNGPISITVFTHGQDVTFALNAMTLMHTCIEHVSKQVSFHLVLPTSHPPVDLRSVMKMKLKCDDLKTYLKHGFQGKQTENFENYDIPYPANFLRNISVTFSKSEYIFLSDIDLVPSKGLNINLQNMFQKLPNNSNGIGKKIDSDKLVYVIPSFEHKFKNISSITKRHLLKEWENNNIRQFYFQNCHQCQQLTNYDRWRKLAEDDLLDVAYIVKWQHPWEPFYVARETGLPAFDGRFKQFGFDRVSQQCEMATAGYTFAVLNNAFVVHRGFKTPRSFSVKGNEDNNKNRMLYWKLKGELKIRYSRSPVQCEFI